MHAALPDARYDLPAEGRALTVRVREVQRVGAKGARMQQMEVELRVEGRYRDDRIVQVSQRHPVDVGQLELRLDGGS